MKNYTLLRNKNKSYGSKNVENTIGLEFEQSTKQFTNNDIVGTVDANEQFLIERDACKDYRLVLTINPFCSNELFNTCTEIVWKEGSDKCVNITDNEFFTFNDRTFYPVTSRDINGKSSNLTRRDMIDNTEYSSENIGLEYHPGYDIFNNHTIRNKSYRVVNPLPRQATQAEKERFNTLSDYMRLSNGSYIEKCNRFNIEDTSFVSKHLYDRDDILGFEDGESLDENLREEDGWFGFYNTSVIPSKERDGSIMDVNRVMNNKGNCSFVDMYPDRSLFSFVPKYNPYRDRTEDNWEIVLTYAYDSTVKFENNKDIELVQSNGVNALAIASVSYVINQNGIKVLLFRTYTKHNLKQNDNIYLYFSEDENVGNWIKTSKPYRIMSIGDLDSNYQDYYFTIYDTELLNTIFATTRDDRYTSWDYVRDYFYNQVSETDIDISSVVHYGSRGLTNIPTAGDEYVEVGGDYYELYSHDNGKSYQEMKCEVETSGKTLSVDDFIMLCINNAFTVNDPNVSESSIGTGDGSQYDVYISFRFTKAVGNTECQYYVRKFKKIPNMKNGHDGVEDMPFDNEKYRLAYADTIYGDPIYQAVFTDRINVEGLKTNLGYEPREIFATIVKTNVGHNDWYSTQPHYSDYVDTNDEKHRVEYSHCFGNVTCGFDLFAQINETATVKRNRRNLYDVKFINNSSDNTIKTLGNRLDITADDEWFYGDVVEFNPSKYIETVLCDVDFRFNTMQRELSAYPQADIERYVFKFDEIKSDDYDKDGFDVVTTEKSIVMLDKKEGYYYKPHYSIKLKGYSPIIQGSYFNLIVNHAEPVSLPQNNGIYIKVTTSLRHNCATGDQLVLKDNTSPLEWGLPVLSILSPYTFIMSKIDRSDNNYIDWISICNYLNDNSYSIKKVNTSIPDYAIRINSGAFVWREPANAWDIDNEDEELKEYVFANGNLYIDEQVNFFLRRQDPNAENGLRINEIAYPYVADIGGEINDKESIYPYKEEYEAIC